MSLSKYSNSSSKVLWGDVVGWFFSSHCCPFQLETHRNTTASRCSNMQRSVRKIRSAGESNLVSVSVIHPSPNNLTLHRQTLNASISTDEANREGLYSFLHDELRISSDLANAYCNAFQSNGYDDVSSLQDATEQDLKDMGVKIGHVRRIKRVVFASCMRNERNERHRKNLVAEVLEESMANRKALEGSLLSNYARQEMIKWSPASKDPHVDSS